MLTKLIVKKFKVLEDIEIDLSPAVVFIGPNNSGKTSALQAIALWETGLRAWWSKRGTEHRELKRPGVTINRRDLISSPIPNALLLWNDLHVRETSDINGKKFTKNVLIKILVEGVTGSKKWECGFEFDYANNESIYCRPLRSDEDGSERYPLPEESLSENIRVAFLPPMSGLISVEPKWEEGRVNVLIGEGQTAQVLRNLCLTVSADETKWNSLVEKIKDLFGITISSPEYIKARGEVIMNYKTIEGIDLDLSSSGRGLQQTLLILSYLYANPNTVILLDEPDAHLEILRQRQIYQLISDLAREQNSQIICASHSEIVLEEAAEKDTVIAFVGNPHIINDKQQPVKALREIGFQDYYLAEEKGFVLYLEGSTDLSILIALAEKLEHPAAAFLKNTPFVKYLGNNIPKDAEKHYYALKEAYPSLIGVAVFDRVAASLTSTDSFKELMWKKREIENYICKKEVLIRYIVGEEQDLFSSIKKDTFEKCINDLETALKTLQKPDPWGPDCKVTDDFLDPLFENYLREMHLPENAIRKKSYYEIAHYIEKDEISEDITETLDLILEMAKIVKRKI